MKTLANPADRRALVARLDLLSPDICPRWGKMTANQMLCHLSDSFRVALGDKQASEGPAPGRLPRPVVRWMALYVIVRWPKGVPTRPEVQQGLGGTPPTQFAHDRVTLLQLIDRFTSADIRSHHPIFHRMSKRDWRRWGYLHVDHHLRQFGV